MTKAGPAIDDDRVSRVWVRLREYEKRVLSKKRTDEKGWSMGRQDE